MSIDNTAKKRPKKEDDLFGFSIYLFAQAMKGIGERIAECGLAEAVEMAVLFIGKFFSLFQGLLSAWSRYPLDNLEPDNS